MFKFYFTVMDLEEVRYTQNPTQNLYYYAQNA